MDLEVLVPTHNKSQNDLYSLCASLGIVTPFLIINQCDINNEICFKGGRFINVNDIGVSRNRNNLLFLSKGKYCVCIDDDCPLVFGYENVIDSFFKKHPDAEFVLFNGIVSHENNRLIHKKKSKRVKRFSDVSYAGGPGLVFKRDTISKYNIKYDTNVGYPNYITLGEDSLFIKSIVDSKAIFYRSSDILFIIKDDIDNSVYFKGVNEQFVVSRGYITKKIHPVFYKLYGIKYVLYMYKWRNNSFTIKELLFFMKQGYKYNANKDISE